MKKADLFFNVIRVPVDWAMLFLAGFTTYILRTKLISAFRPVQFQLNLPLLYYLFLVSIVALVFVGIYAVSGLYSMKVRRGITEELFKIFVASLAGIMVVVMYIFLSRELFDSRFLVLGAWLIALVFVCIGRLLVRYIQYIAVVKYDFGTHRVLLIGSNSVAEEVKQNIQSNPSIGYRLVDHWNIPRISDLEGIKDDIDEVVLANQNYSGQIIQDNLAELVDLCHEYHIIFKFIPNLHQSLTKHVDIDMVSHIPIIELRRTPLDGWGKVFKRTADIIGALIGLIVSSPLFLITISAIIFDTPGPAFVRLKRVSKNKEFVLYKFRSMVAHDPDGGAESLKVSLVSFNERKDGPLFKIKNDPRVTRVGRFIRKYRIDELPQFINILKGDMSLVGPRPHQPDEVSQYQKHHKKVLAIKAGATGLAQISGSSDIPFEEEVAIDSFYIENWSLLLDLKIIAKTTFRMLTDKSAV